VASVLTGRMGWEPGLLQPGTLFAEKQTKPSLKVTKIRELRTEKVLPGRPFTSTPHLQGHTANDGGAGAKPPPTGLHALCPVGDSVEGPASKTVQEGRIRSGGLSAGRKGSFLGSQRPTQCILFFFSLPFPFPLFLTSFLFLFLFYF
jgi:hypothetical protein